MRFTLVHAVCAGWALTTLTAACDAHSPPRRPLGPAPEQISVPSSTMTFGFALGKTREPKAVEAFRITKSLVTVGDYHACVAAGACSAPALRAGGCTHPSGPDGPTYSEDASARDLPVTCATARQATDYCEWIGGRLPRLTEWLLAARGPDVHRYAWGDEPPRCAQAQRISYFASVPDACCGVTCSSADAARVRRHPDGASPLGLQDVLITRAELFGPDAAPQQHGCPVGATGCLVHGIASGAIDGIAPAMSLDETEPVSVMTAAYGFRCAWEGGAQ
jgi:formylglycine-generating enzyme required for sulfatase activity